MFVSALIAFVVAALGSWLLARYSFALRLIDVPNDRSSHSTPTPRGGGIAVVVASIVGLILLPAGIPVAFRASLLPAASVAVVGLLDDRFGLSAKVRLALHLSAGLAVALTQIPVDLSRPTTLITPALAAASIAWGTNLFNFMDGIDGIAGSEAVFVCAMAGLLIAGPDGRAAEGLCVVGAASLGFLLLNWAPARIFMGDVGSGFLGFLLAAFAFTTIWHHLIPLPVWLVITSAFLVDASVTLFRRMVSGERWWSAHRSHAYQHLSIRLGSHARATIAVQCVNILVLAPTAYFMTSHREFAWALCAVIIVLLFAVAMMLGAGRPRQSTRGALESRL